MDDDAEQAQVLQELRAKVAVQHFGDPAWSDMLTNVTEDGLRSQAESLRARGVGPSPSTGSPSWAAEEFRHARRQQAWHRRIFGDEHGGHDDEHGGDGE